MAIKLSLIVAGLGKPFVEHRPQLLVAQKPPAGARMVARWRFAGETFQNDVGSEATKNLDEKIDILVQNLK